MNIFNFFFIAILLASDSESFTIEESTTLQTTIEQKTLLKKLQNFQEAKNETKPLMWNEILADVFVNKIKIFSLKHNHLIVNEETKQNTLTLWLGNVLVLYKQLIYDKFVYTPKKHIIEVTELSDKDIISSDSDTNVSDEGLNHFQDIFVNKKLNSTNPKGDVEIIEPKYHGRITDEDREKLDEEDKAIVCPEGYVNSDRGCLDQNSRLILAIPNQCPSGYILDRLGYCRMRFTFQ